MAMNQFEYTVIMPKMSMTMEEGELLSFRVEVGDVVKSGDVLFDVATDKIDMEVESPADGVVKEIVGKTGSTMLVGAPVLLLLTETQVMSFDFNSPETQAPDPVGEVLAGELPLVSASFASNPEPDPEQEVAIKAVPKARLSAQSRGIDLHGVTPTGPFGTITYEDVSGLGAASGNEARKAANRAKVASAIERTRAIPQITLTRLTPHTARPLGERNAHLVSAWAGILRSHPHVNVSSKDAKLHNVVGVGLILESRYGLAVPVFKDPDLLSDSRLVELIQATRTQAIEGRVPIEMLSGSTTSIFDLSHTKISSAIPMLFPSHTTALSVGAPNSSTSESEVNLTVDLRYCDALEAADLLDQLIDAL